MVHSSRVQIKARQIKYNLDLDALGIPMGSKGAEGANFCTKVAHWACTSIGGPI